MIKIDMSDNKMESVVLNFANGISLVIDQCSDTKAGTTGVVVKSEGGKVMDLKCLSMGESAFYNPCNHGGFILTTKKNND